LRFQEIRQPVDEELRAAVGGELPDQLERADRGGVERFRQPRQVLVVVGGRELLARGERLGGAAALERAEERLDVLPGRGGGAGREEKRQEHARSRRRHTSRRSTGVRG